MIQYNIILSPLFQIYFKYFHCMAHKVVQLLYQETLKKIPCWYLCCFCQGEDELLKQTGMLVMHLLALWSGTYLVVWQYFTESTALLAILMNILIIYYPTSKNSTIFSLLVLSLLLTDASSLPFVLVLTVMLLTSFVLCQADVTLK